MIKQWFRTLLEKDDQYSRILRLTPRRHWLWWPAVFFAHSGDSWFWMIGLGLVWLFDASDWHGRAATLAIFIVIQALVVFALKFTIKRSRPEGDWGSIYRTTDPHSFPSGHATRAAMLLVSAAGLGPEWFFWAVLCWAPLVCLARVMTGVHYLSDILGGIVLGSLFGLFLLQLQPFFQAILPFLYSDTFLPTLFSWFVH